MRQVRLGFLFVGLCLLSLSTSSAGAAGVRAYEGRIELPTYPWAAVKHPYFRGTDQVNIYPYRMLDFLSREKTNRTYRTVVLENEYLRITFLPELGGKIHEVIDKTTGEPVFYVNHVVKPGLIGQCGAWTSGGVEWNTGPQGHTVSCMTPVAVATLPPNEDGSRSVAIGETERIYGTHWTVVVTLQPGRAFIEERVRIYNPTETIRPYYFWNCTAAPNTPGFRFIYPMTLGCDHAGEKFFEWPVDHGKDLTRGTNYQDASSIFAWHCDQDFFGSYNDDLGRGVVAYANHHQVPGKKAWTWGQGGFGKMHQMDLTDTDGPYNEVQTGPLLTQAQVGRLDPCEAVEWNEWWYPVHGLGGFTYANRDLAVNATRQGANLTLSLLGTAEWKSAEVWVSTSPNPADAVVKVRCHLSPNKPIQLRCPLSDSSSTSQVLYVRVRAGQTDLAQFRVPAQYPLRTPPAKKPAPESAGELAASGWQEFLFGKFTDAERQFRKAIEKDAKCAEAQLGLAFLKLDSDPAGAAESGRTVVGLEPDSGLGHFALAVASERVEPCRREEAEAEAWKAGLSPVTAVASRAFLGKLHLRDSAAYREAIRLLTQAGPWQADPLCRNRLALALLKTGDKRGAVQLARQNLVVDPLDAFARSLLWLADAESKGLKLGSLIEQNPHTLFDLVADYADLLPDDWEPVNRLLRQFAGPDSGRDDPLGYYWRAEGRQLSHQLAPRFAAAGVAPYHREALPVFRHALERDPNDGQAALYLGHLFFHLGRYSEGRAQWQRAAQLGFEPVMACRALGMAAKTLDGDLKTAREWLEKASQADPQDAIVARDLANVLFALAEKAGTDADRNPLIREACDRLQAAFPSGQGRSDFVALLARANNRLGEYAATAQMLDRVRVTVWEGAHEVHDLFEQAHLALGEAHLKAGRPEAALVEFNRALEYPVNLATGKLENAREAPIHFQRGNALAALGRKAEARAAWKMAADEPESKDSRIEEARQKAKAALADAPR